GLSSRYRARSRGGKRRDRDLGREVFPQDQSRPGSRSDLPAEINPSQGPPSQSPPFASMIRFPALIAGTLLSAVSAAQQSDFYLRDEFPLPAGEVMELGSIALPPDREIAVTSRRGDLWICSGAYEDDLSKVTWRKFAEGLHEPL